MCDRQDVDSRAIRPDRREVQLSQLEERWLDVGRDESKGRTEGLKEVEFSRRATKR
jgi:hypothetical protein